MKLAMERRTAGGASGNDDNPEEPAQGMVSVGNLTLNFDTFQTTVAGERVDLTYDEFELLSLLAGRPNRVVAYDVLARHLWDISGRVANRRLNVIIHRIRAKLGDLGPYEI